MIRHEERSFEVIISDHIMPNMTGVELCTELKRRHHLSERILVTGFAELDMSCLPSMMPQFSVILQSR